MASNRDDEVIADSEGEYGGDAVTSHHPNVILPPRSSPEKANTSSRNFFSTIETVSDFQVQPSEKVSSISDFTAPPQPPTSLISSITTPSIAQPVLSEIVESFTSFSSECPDKPKKRPRPRPRVRPPKPAPDTEQPSTGAPPKTGDNAPSSSSERKTKILPEMVVLVPPLPKKRPSTSAPPQETVAVSSSDVEEIPVQTAAKKRKLSNPAGALSSPRPAKPSRKPNTLLLSDEDEDDPIQLKGSEPPKSPRLSLGPTHSSSLPTAKDAPATAKPIYDDDRLSDFDPSESSKPAKKPKSKAKAKKAQVVHSEVEAEDGLVDQAAAPPPKVKKPRKSKGKTKRAGDEGMAMPGDDGFKSKEFIQDSDEGAEAVSDPASQGGLNITSTISELGMPRPEPRVESPVRKRKAQEDISPPPKRASIDDSEGKLFLLSAPDPNPERYSRSFQGIVGPVDPAPAVPTADSRPEKPKKKRKSKADKAPPTLDDAPQQTAPADESTMDAGEPMQLQDAGKGTTKKPKSKSRPSPQADREPLPNPSRPSEPCESEDGTSEPPCNVGSASSPAKEYPAPTKDRPSTPVSSSSAGPRGSIPYWRRPNKPLTELLNQATPGSSARQSGLHKSIRIAPLHMNRKPPPPPLPPIPKKKPAKKGDGSGSEDDDETPKARLKRLAAEYESLEGMESKKANDRRKEIVEEMARLTN
ncbi:hypothetical protein FRC01_006015 [Tulasnella sp. 417]|nr:hypothetical protein FRC01_006015 [Tulasnella sp. 417]